MLNVIPIGKHVLKVISVEKKTSKIRDNHKIITLITETQDTDIPYKVYIYLSDHGSFEYSKMIINKFSSWHGSRMGKSILQLDLIKLIGKEAEFVLTEESYMNKKFPTVKYKENVSK